MMSYVVADDRGWIDHQAAYERIRTLLARAVALQDPVYDRLGVPPSQQGNRHGYLYHFVDNQGFRHPGSEISTIDHALFAAGAVVAAGYYQGTEVEQLARQLLLNTDWNWLFDGTFLYQGWIEESGGSFEGGRTLDRWDRYSELLILLFLALGHPDASKAIPPAAWDALTYGTDRMFPFEYAHLFPGDAPQNFAFVPSMPNTINEPGFTNSTTEFHYIHAGSLHNHQYSHLFADFRARRDRYQTDFFTNSVSAAMANRQFCINLNSHAFGGDPTSPDPYLRQPYETYGPESWGIMASIPSYTGYAVLQPIVISWDDFSPNNIALNNDSGTVVLSAPLGSTPFTPRQTADFARNMLARFQANQSGYDALVGRYGFMNAFNLGRPYNASQIGHFAINIIGLDMGPVVGSIENHHSGLIWKLAMRNQFIEQGLRIAGFPTGDVEPFILNFDDNPPAPHEDPNGGGQDPNSFGGSSFAFGSGSVAYVWIDDPFPSMNFGPQQWAQRISALDKNDSGAFILLNNHSVSRWDRLSFWIRGEVGGEAYSVGLKDRVIDRLGSPLQATEVKLPIGAYHPAGSMTSQWTEVRIPLRDFADQGVRLTELDNISFTNLSAGGGAIYVDDIAFLGDEFVPPAPQGLSALTDGRSVTLTWQANTEPDVVGYRIARSDDGGLSFTPLNTFLVVETTFTDATVAYGERYRYRISAVDNAQPPNESAPSEVAIRVFWPGDYDLNGQVTIGEVTNTVAFFLEEQTPTTEEAKLVDLNADGRVSIGEVVLVIKAFLQSGPQEEIKALDLNADGITTEEEVQAVVLNQPPTANAGADHTVTDTDGDGKATVQLDGSASFDPDGDPLTYTWAEGEVALATGVSPTVTLSLGIHTISLTVSDGKPNGTNTDTVIIAVQDAAPPQVTITEPAVGASVPSSGFAFRGTAQDQSGIAEVRIYVYDTGRQTFTVPNALATGSTSWTFVVQSSHVTAGQLAYLYVRAKDGVGNWSSWQFRWVSVKAAQTVYPWQVNANGTLDTKEWNWNYTMGYQFTPQVNGQITHLGGYFKGSKTVRLYDGATGSVLAQASVTGDNTTWRYAPISSIAVKAGNTYVVAVYLAGSGGSARWSINPLPQTYGSIQILKSVYRYNSTAMPTSGTTSHMYGQADIGFQPAP